LLALIKRYVYQQVGFDEKGKTKPCLVLLDYIKMSDKVDKNSWVEHEWQALGEFSKKLKCKIGIQKYLLIAGWKEAEMK